MDEGQEVSMASVPFKKARTHPEVRLETAYAFCSSLGFEGGTSQIWKNMCISVT